MTKKQQEVIKLFDEAIELAKKTYEGDGKEYELLVEAQTKAFDAAFTKCGWDWEGDTAFADFALKATSLECLTEGKRRFLDSGQTDEQLARETAEAIAKARGYEDAALDLDIVLIVDAIRRSKKEDSALALLRKTREVLSDAETTVDVVEEIQKLMPELDAFLDKV